MSKELSKTLSAVVPREVKQVMLSIVLALGHAKAKDPQSCCKAVQSNRHWQIHASSRLPQPFARSQESQAQEASCNKSGC